MDEIIEKLKELGLNEYQSKVYVALLKKISVNRLRNKQTRKHTPIKNL